MNTLTSFNKKIIITPLKKIDYKFFIVFFLLLEKSNMMLSILYSDKLSKLNFNIISELNNIRYKRIFTHSFFILFALSFAFLFSELKRLKFYIGSNIVFSMFLVLDLCCARSIGKFFSIDLILHEHYGFFKLLSLLKYIKPIDIVFFIDIVILIILYNKKVLTSKCNKNLLAFILVAIFSISSVVFSHYIIDIKKRFYNLDFKSRYWEPFSAMYDSSPLGYHIFEGYDKLTQHRNIKLSEKDIKEIDTWFEKNLEHNEPNKYKGIFKDKNLIILQLESFEAFMIDQKIADQEITPNLNRRLKNSLYFPNFHEQINYGVSSDADLMTNTGLFPIRKESTFCKNHYSKYNSLPDILGDKNYYSFLLHGEKGGNWNFESAANSIGFDKVYTEKIIPIKPEEEHCFNCISDENILTTFSNLIMETKEPFYGAAVTLNSHFPFHYAPKDSWELELPETLNDTTMEKYLQTINYVDRDIERFLGTLDEKGILDNSIVVIYGDHTGIHKYNNSEIPDLDPKMDWWIDNDLKIPLIIYSKDFDGQIVNTIGGQVDVLPTLCYLLGIDESKFSNSSVGKVLVNTKKNYTLLNDGSIVGDIKDEAEKAHALKAFEVSDKIIRGNYFKIKNSPHNH